MNMVLAVVSCTRTMGRTSPCMDERIKHVKSTLVCSCRQYLTLSRPSFHHHDHQQQRQTVLCPHFLRLTHPKHPLHTRKHTRKPPANMLARRSALPRSQAVSLPLAIYCCRLQQQRGSRSRRSAASHWQLNSTLKSLDNILGSQDDPPDPAQLPNAQQKQQVGCRACLFSCLACSTIPDQIVQRGPNVGCRC